MSFVYRAQQPQPPVPPVPVALLFPAAPPPPFPGELFRWTPNQALYEYRIPPPFRPAASVPVALLYPAVGVAAFPPELLGRLPLTTRWWLYHQGYVRALQAPGLAVFVPSPPPVVGVPFDVYAWFPGDPGPGPPTRPGRRYEEYAQDRPRKRRKGPLRIPVAAARHLEEVPGALPLLPFPLTWPRPLADLAALGPLPAPQRSAAAVPDVYPVPPGAGADWTAYAHLPIDPAEEEEELAILLHLGRRRR